MHNSLNFSSHISATTGDGESGSRGSQRSHLDDVDLGRSSGLGGQVELLEVVTGDDEDDGGGVEGDPLLGPLPAVTGAGHHDGSDGALGRAQGPLLQVVLEPRDPGTQQLEEAASELGEKTTRGRDSTKQVVL